MDFVNFKVGTKTISLKILDILLTERYEKDLTPLPNGNESFLGIKDYMQTPTPVFDLGVILNKRSTEQENHSLIEQLQLLEGKYAQLIKDDEGTLKDNPNFHEITSWYTHSKVSNADVNEVLDKVIQLHSQLPNLAHLALQQTINNIRRLIQAAKESLSSNFKPIIVYTTTDGITPHIGLLVDKVEQSTSVDAKNIKSLSELTAVGFKLDKETKNMMAGLIKLEQGHAIIIDPRAIFRTEYLEPEPS